MGFRFRKSVKLGPGVKLNLGKKSVGISVGGKGGGISFNTKSGACVRASIPKTGISYSSKIGSLRGKKNTEYKQKSINSVKLCPTPRKTWYIILAVFLISGIGYLQENTTTGLLTALIGGIMLFFTARSPKRIKIDAQAFNRQLQIFDESIKLFMSTNVPETFWGRYEDAEKAAHAMANMTDAPIVHGGTPQAAIDMLQNDKTSVTNAFLDRYEKEIKTKAFQLTRGRKTKIESFKLITDEYADKMPEESIIYRDELYEEMLSKIADVENT